MAPLDLMGTWEVTQKYGISRQRIYRLMEQGKWPQPAADLHAGGVWHRRDVVAAVARLTRDGVLK